MKILELLVNEGAGATQLSDSSGQRNDGRISPAGGNGAKPARIVGFAPPGYRANSVRFRVDDLPGNGSSVEPDNVLQFIQVDQSRSIRRINETREFTTSLWAFHELLPTGARNPWENPRAPSGKTIFCPQHVCVDKSLYTFVRTKNIGCQVPKPDRGQLALTGPGDPDIIGCGGLGDELGGVDSDEYHVPINEWVHLAFVLDPPNDGNPGRWRIYANGQQVSSAAATASHADPDVPIILDKEGADIRFGNFRGNTPPGNRPPPIAEDASDYAFNGYLTGIRVYDHAQNAAEIQADIETDVSAQAREIEFREGFIHFPHEKGGRQRLAKTVRFPGEISNYQVALKGFNIRYDNGDHHILALEKDLDSELIDRDSVRVHADFVMRDSSGNFDDPYTGWVHFAVIAEMAQNTDVPPEG